MYIVTMKRKQVLRRGKVADDRAIYEIASIRNDDDCNSNFYMFFL